MTAIIVLAKAPVAGRVKTRCCPPCSPAQAAILAEAALADTLTTVAATDAHCKVLALDGSPGRWLAAGFDVIRQRGRGLGERIDNAFSDVGGPAVLIGMDTPQVDVAMLDRALGALQRPTVDAVVGPATDGGFWLLGLAEPVVDLCAGVTMSISTTGARLCGALVRRGLAVHELEPLTDVDDYATAVAVSALVPGSRFARTVDVIAAALPLELRVAG